MRNYTKEFKILCKKAERYEEQAHGLRYKFRKKYSTKSNDASGIDFQNKLTQRAGIVKVEDKIRAISLEKLALLTLWHEIISWQPSDKELQDRVNIKNTVLNMLGDHQCYDPNDYKISVCEGICTFKREYDNICQRSYSRRSRSRHRRNHNRGRVRGRNSRGSRYRYYCNNCGKNYTDKC